MRLRISVIIAQTTRNLKFARKQADGVIGLQMYAGMRKHELLPRVFNSKAHPPPREWQRRITNRDGRLKHNELEDIQLQPNRLVDGTCAATRRVVI